MKLHKEQATVHLRLDREKHWSVQGEPLGGKHMYNPWSVANEASEQEKSSAQSLRRTARVILEKTLRKDTEHVWHVKHFTGGRQWQHPLLSPCRAALHTFAGLAFAVGADVVEVHRMGSDCSGRLA